MVTHEGIRNLNAAFSRLKHYEKFASITIVTPHHSIPRGTPIINYIVPGSNGPRSCLTFANIVSVVNKNVAYVIRVVLD